MHEAARAIGTLSRRAALVAAGAAAAGCAGWRAPTERIVDLATGREIDVAALLARLRGCDAALLGELHDNPRHHARRGALIAALGADAAVFAEHLPRGGAVHFGPDLRASLVEAGFDPRAWRWPLHEPLFAAVARSGAPLAGANAPAELVRRIAREGRAALPADLAAALDAAPLAPAAQAALDADLVDGHCGHLSAARLPAMRSAQRARDATMALALAEALAARREAPRRAPVVLLAGNGHVRTDYGAGQLLARIVPVARIVAVAFVEPGSALAGARYTHAWVTPAVLREDPCAGLAGGLGSAASAPR